MSKSSSTWIKRLRPASFKGVPFLVDSYTYSSQRRFAEQYYPQRNFIQRTDQGQGEQIYSVNAYIIGDDYWQERDELAKVLNDTTAGIFVNSYGGDVNCSCASFTMAESVSEGRIVYFTINFKLEEEQPETNYIAINTATNIAVKKQSLLDSILDWFDKAYTIANQPVGALTDLNNGINEAFKVIEATRKLASTQANFKRQISNLQGKVQALGLNARYLSTSFKELIDYGTNPNTALSFGRTANNSLEQLLELNATLNFKNTKISEAPDAILDDESYPLNVFQLMFGLQVFAAMGGLFASIPFVSVNDSEQRFNALSLVLDDLLTSTVLTLEVETNLMEYLSAIKLNLTDRFVSFPKITTYTIDVFQTNLLTVVYDLYGSLDNIDDIINRNGLRNPLFLNYSTVLEIKEP